VVSKQSYRPQQSLDILPSGEKQSKPVRIIKVGIWLYFFLLIFEGALRKWVLPGLSGPLLIVRDPIAIGLIVFAWYHNLFPTVSYVVYMTLIGILAFFAALFLGHGNMTVAIYGARILLIHFPFIFLIGSLFKYDDVLKMGKVVILLAIPMAILIAMQFYSPQSALVNRGVGGDIAGGGFSGAMGYFRPPGTFSFTNGTTLFFSLVASFVCFFWIRPKGVNKFILLAATASLIVAIPLSISRGLTFTVVIVVGFLLVSVLNKPKYFFQMVVGGIGIWLLLAVISNLDFFNTATEVFLKRFENAAVSEGGLEGTLGERYFGGMIKAISEASELPFFGVGLGMGTNAASALLSGGRTFIVSEGEWGRLVGEMGALLGIGAIAIRLHISFKLALASYAKMRGGNLLPWMLLSIALLVFPQGQWAQPTTLGFSTLIMGLLIASFNVPDEAGDFGSRLTNQHSGENESKA
jgi:hypothetical protein